MQMTNKSIIKAPRIFSMSFSSVYSLYLAKAEKKNRTPSEVDEIICWLTGYSLETLKQKINDVVNFTDFFNDAPNLNPNRHLIKGSICGIKIDEIEDNLMREIRYLDKLIDELAKGRPIDLIKRVP